MVEQVDEHDVRSLITAMDTNGDGSVTLKEFASFLSLDDDEPLYQPLFDGRRRTVNILQVTEAYSLFCRRVKKARN